MSPVAAGTVTEALTAARDALAAAGVDTPRLDAEVLLAEALGVDRAALRTGSEDGVEPAAARIFGAMVRRRVRREPVAYITGRKGFRRIELAVDRRVLIPRPETELLVEVALELEPASVVDVGTGSGSVALAIADEMTGVSLVGVDTSAPAIDVARANAERLGLGGEGGVEFEVLAPSTRSAGTRRQDLVVANLPYVRDADWATLAPEIRDYEPKEALLGGPDGLGPIRALLGASPDCAAIALEVGEGQAREVEGLVAAAGFEKTERRRDLAGIERVILGLRK
ncbi:MAG: release factor glutamine methyltransferase [Solirubrobacterales bacterium]|jgi:release factor glutamine methyltransferase|nr:release factor glutamine methyltransferase [Solirubrobacterales bacterium]